MTTLSRGTDQWHFDLFVGAGEMLGDIRAAAAKWRFVPRSVSSPSARFGACSEQQVRRAALQRLTPQAEGGFGPSGHIANGPLLQFTPRERSAVQRGSDTCLKAIHVVECSPKGTVRTNDSLLP